MFDFSFTELMVVGVVALVVIGPERLPKVAREVGRWTTKLRRYVDDVKSDLNRQMDLAELRNLQAEVKEAATNFKGTVDSALEDARGSFKAVEEGLDASGVWNHESLPDASGNASAETAGAALADDASQPRHTPRPTDWDKVYAVRRTRDRLRERRIEQEQARGFKRPRRPLHR